MKAIQKLKLTVVVLIATSVFGASSMVAQTNTKKEADKRNDAKFENADDAELLVKAYNSGMAEVKLADKMKTRAVSAEVKALASKMSMEHSAMNAKIQEVATKKNISLPTQLTNDQVEDVADVTKESATEIDMEYLDQLSDSHKKSIELFEKGSKATDLDVRDLFISGLPKIRSHYDMVQNSRQKMKEQKESQRKSGMK